MFRVPTGGTPRRSYLSGGMQRSVHLFKAHWSDHLHNKHKDVVKRCRNFGQLVVTTLSGRCQLTVLWQR